MKVGDVLVGKFTGREFVVGATKEHRDGCGNRVTLFQVDGCWRTKEYIEKYYLFPVGHPSVVTTAEIGDIFVGKFTETSYEVVAKRDDESRIYWSDKCNEHSAWEKDEFLFGDAYVAPTRHRFYIEDDTLRCYPPLNLVPGVHDPLELSIRKWEVIAAHPKLVRESGRHCALCVAVPEANCRGCPIAEQVGVGGCKNTPYIDYTAGNLGAAQEMVDFLKSLRASRFEVGDIVQWNRGYNTYRVVGVENNVCEIENVEDECTQITTTNRLSPTHYFYVRDSVLCVEPHLTGREPDPLELSIRKWRAIVSALEKGVEVRSDGAGATCALCRFTVPECSSGVNCSRCCVFRHTGKKECVNTPYVWWQASRSLPAAKAELAFLEGLRDGA